MLPFIFFIALFTEQQDNIDKSGIRWSFSTKSEENHFIFLVSMKKKKYNQNSYVQNTRRKRSMLSFKK